MFGGLSKVEIINPNNIIRLGIEVFKIKGKSVENHINKILDLCKKFNQS